MPGLDPTSIAIAAIPSVIQSFSGLLGIGQGKNRAKKNPFPTETVNPLFAQNLAIAEQAGRQGLPQAQVNQAQQGFQRNQNMGLRQLGRMGRPSNVAGLVRAGNDSQLALDVADANARQANQQRAMGYRSQLAGEQNRVWDWNNKTRFAQEAQASGQQIGAGKQNFMGGLSNLSMLGQYALMGRQGNDGSTGGMWNWATGSPSAQNGWAKSFLPYNPYNSITQ